MRLARGLFGTIAIAILFAALAVFAVENIAYVPITYVGRPIAGNIWWIVTGSALIGFTIATILLAPGRVAAGWRSYRLRRDRDRDRDQHEVELMALRERTARLQAELDQARAGVQPGQTTIRSDGTTTTTETTTRQTVS